MILNESEVKNFPNTDKAWPDTNKKPLWDNVTVHSVLYASEHYTRIVRKMSDNTTIHFHYLEALLNLEVDFKVSQYEEEGAVLFENDEYRALIMPMRI